MKQIAVCGGLVLIVLAQSLYEQMGVIEVISSPKCIFLKLSFLWFIS